MKIKRGVLVGIVVLLALAHHLPAQSTDPALTGEPIRPEPTNLDIPPVIVPDPVQSEQAELAAQAIERPQDFHNWLLQLDLGRALREELAAFALLQPDAFRRRYPPPPGQIRDEVLA